jgi:hypothetical protein
MLAHRPTPKLKDHPMSAVCDCLFNMFAATLCIWRPSPLLATREREDAVVTVDPLNMAGAIIPLNSLSRHYMGMSGHPHALAALYPPETTPGPTV